MDTSVSARIDRETKEMAEAVLSQLGINHSMVINALYAQIVLRGALPFEVAVPKRTAISFYAIRKAVVDAAREFGIARVWLFGSCARGDASASSDVDLLVDRGDARALAVGGFQDRVSQVLQVPVDVVTLGAASDKFREAIKTDQVLIYES